MPYIGNSPAEKYASFAVQHFTTSATTTYSLTHAVANENDIRLVINNVIQEPGSGKAYTASGTTLTLSSATSGTDTMYCVFLGKAVQTVVPPAGSVTGSTLADDVISAQTALSATPADTDEFLVSDAGVLKRVDYSYMKASTTDEFRPNAMPLIINGDMAVAQRATSVTGWNAVGYTTVDRFKTVCEIGTYTIIQESLTSGNAFADGFKNALRMDCTTATASGSAGDQTTFEYRMEGFDTLAFKKGTANAQKSTLAFWVKASKTGSNLQVNLRDNTNDRQVGGTYSISSANTWEHKVINFPADTTGALADANTAELIIEWWLDGGSNYSGGAVPTSWEAKDNADRNVTNFDLGGSTSNDWAITGVQFEVGEYSASTLPPYQFQSYGNNLARCQRYYYFHVSEAENGGSDTTISLTSQYNSSSMKGFISFPTQMRTKPSLKQNTGSNMYRLYESNSNATMTSLTLSGETTYNTAVFTAGSTISVTQGSSGTLQTMDSTAYVAFDAEL